GYKHRHRDPQQFTMQYCRHPYGSRRYLECVPQLPQTERQYLLQREQLGQLRSIRLSKRSLQGSPDSKKTQGCIGIVVLILCILLLYLYRLKEGMEQCRSTTPQSRQMRVMQDINPLREAPSGVSLRFLHICGQPIQVWAVGLSIVSILQRTYRTLNCESTPTPNHPSNYLQQP